MTNNFSFSDEVERLGLTKKDKILVAFSGGGDSTFLLLQALKYFKRENVKAAYVNYHDSEHTPEEEKIVTDFCIENEVTLCRKDVNLHWTTTDFEAKARDIRYNYFKELIDQYNLKGVLVAHHANDDAETYLFQKERGSIVKTLGLSPKSNIYGIDVYRPLLSLKKSEIISFLDDNNIVYFDDPTNKNWDRCRDRLRMTILSADENVDKVIEEKNSQLKFNDEEVRSAKDFISKDVYLLSDYHFLTNNVKKRVLFTLLKSLFDNNDKVISSMNLCYEYLKSKNTGYIELSDSIYLYKDKYRFFFGKPLSINDYCYQIDKPGIYEFHDIFLDIHDPSLFKIKEFPIFIKPVKKGDLISTNLEGKDAWNTMKKHDVPSYLRDIYPALYKADGAISYLPFYPNKYLFIKIGEYTFDQDK